MAYGPGDDEDDEPDQTASAFMGSGSEDDDEVGKGPEGQPSSLATGVKTNAPGASSIHAAVGSSADDDYLQPPPAYNPPSRPAALDTLSSKIDQEGQDWEKLSQPVNRADYKPSTGRRILGSLAGAMVAAGSRNPAAGYSLGTSVIDAPYNRAVQDQQTRANAAGQVLKNDQTTYGREDRDYENSLNQYDKGYNAQVLSNDRMAQAAGARARAARAAQQPVPGSEAPDDPKNPLGSWHATAVNGQPIKMQGPPDKWLSTPQGKEAVETKRRTDLVTSQHLSGEDAKDVMVNGKLRDKPAITKNEPEGKAQWDAYVNSLGHVPTTEDVLTYKRGQGRAGNTAANKSLMDRIESQKNTAMDKARQNYGNGSDPSYTKDDYIGDLQSAQDNYEDRLQTATGNDIPHLEVKDHLDMFGLGNQPKGAAPQQAKAAPTAQPAAPQPTATPAVQPGQPARPTGLPDGAGQQLDRNTAQDFLKAAGGDKAKARTLAAQYHWKF